MNVLLGVFLIWSLPFVGASCGSANVQNIQPGEARPVATAEKGVVTLTTEHPTGSIKLDPDLLKRSPEVLEVSITKVVNPTSSPIDVFVYLASPIERNKPELEKVQLGSFSLYPVDRPGKFMLSPGEAFRKLSETRKASSAEELQLVFEMKLPAEKNPSVEVTIASPKWPDKKN